MRIAAVALLSLCALPAGSIVDIARADSPKVTHAMMEAMQHSLDNKLAGLWPQDPAEVLGLSQGAYIQGYGAIFLGEVNLAPAAGISPFHPTVTPDEVRRTHAKKLQRMAAIRRRCAPCWWIQPGRSIRFLPMNRWLWEYRCFIGKGRIARVCRRRS